ncbi:MAG: HAD-IIA family hydrolase [Actinocatenispora sp.]
MTGTDEVRPQLGDGAPPVLAESAGLIAEYDLLLLDLDGVVYLGSEAVPHAVSSLTDARAAGLALHFVTNNASRRAEEVAARLRGLGLAAEPDEVTTSAQAACAFLAERWPVGATIMVVGADALADEVAAAGLSPTRSADDKPVAVVQGFGADVGWTQLSEASVAIRSGARWIATNTDTTVPSVRGPLPGNGSLVAALAHALGRRPDHEMGKPRPELFLQAVERRGRSRPLVVGDRLDTDIEGAVRAGVPSLLVLTGVCTPVDLLAAPPESRPTYVANDLRELTVPQRAPVLDGDGSATCGGWRATRTAGAVALSGSGDALDALRASCCVVWAGPDVPTVEAASEEAAAVVANWG